MTYTEAAELLRNADSITLVVHGVGDHGATDILAMAELGLGPHLSPLPNSRVEYERVTLPHLPRPPRYTPDITGLPSIPGPDPVATCLRGADGYHLVIPVVWSGVRPRLTDRSRYFGIGLNPMQFVSRALPVLFGTCADAARCIGRAESSWVRAKVAALVLVYLSLTASLLLGVLFLTSHVPFWVGTAGSSRHFWPAWPLLIASLLFLRTSVMGAFRLWDFVGDVVSYVGHSSRREAILKTMREIIEESAARAPRAKLILIGHSLGSVLVTHSLLDSRTPNHAGGRTIVVTLGSPLRLLAHLFAGTICSPAKLAELYESHGTVAGWVNLWRDADVIGRDLSPRSAPSLFAETSLGDGPHADYWRDRRFWDRIAQVIRWASEGQQGLLAVSIGAGHGLTDDEEVQVLAQKAGAYSGAVIQTLLAGGLLWATTTRVFGGGHPLIELVWITCGAAAAAGVFTAVRVALASGEARQRLALHRWWKPWRLLLGRIWVVSVFTLIIAIWWAGR